jgi:hypothetical protein
MKIESQKSKIEGLPKKVNKYLKGFTLQVILIISVMLFISFGSLSLGIMIQRNGISNSINRFISLPLKTTQNYFAGLISKPENIYIDIKFKNFQKILAKRNEALKIGILFSDEYVPALIRAKGYEYKTKLRLKGDFLDHLYGDKWSFRIKVKGENVIYGMKQFSIHNPTTRNTMYEWIFHKLLKKEGLIYLNYNFINVILNGENLGIYALEEHFEKRLVERNQRKEGPILRFNESFHFSQTLQAKSYAKNISIPLTYGSYQSSYIDAFQTNKILRDSIQLMHFSKAASLLEAFKKGKLRTSDVFDIEKLSSFVALLDVLGSYHAATWNNSRFYYNPITSKLEPLGFDSSSGHTLIDFEQSGFGIGVVSGRNLTFSQYLNNLFADELFYSLYIEKLMKYSQKSYLDIFFNDINLELNANLSIIYKEWPTYKFDKSIMYANQAYIREFLNPNTAINVFIKKRDTNSIRLSFGNLQPLDINILNIVINDSIKILPEKKIVLPGKLLEEGVKYLDLDFKMPKNIQIKTDSAIRILVNHEIKGTNRIKSISVYQWNNYVENIIYSDYIIKRSNIKDFDFIFQDIEDKKIFFAQGKHTIYHNIHIPEGFSVYINEGTSLNLLNSSSIISRSQINFIGSEENPISIISSDSTGQGVFVLEAPNRSFLNFVNFENLSRPKKNDWELSGAVTFYESDVTIDQSTFLNNIKGDDYLNIVRSDYSISNTVFKNVNSDAFDSDFCKGSLKNSYFINCGNDGIDISGTYLSIENVNMDSIGDKGISSGENSKLVANNVQIQNSEIAVCSKDMSEINISNITLVSNNIGFTAFQKKPEFGPSSIIATKINMHNIKIPYLIEKKSSCKIDGKFKKSDNDKVKELLYGVIYGKSSK